MGKIITQEMFEKFLTDSIGTRVSIIAEEEIEKAQRNINDRVRKEIDPMALNILKEYDISCDRQNILIRIKKDI